MGEVDVQRNFLFLDELVRLDLVVFNWGSFFHMVLGGFKIGQVVWIITI